ncbi:phosphodiester glycosidase family protein [Paenibacillus sp. GD4]|uniref:phosphodiester glycosidase family protein n=1 Tax=Paenibacillus sp. GD4 TaxID=3068890 RepID=UPI002796B93A|nr:phosphodiester glycosidase family protein [Paenibacillus sp. GD4]MDQ1912380.1 phosphodiester glycosidase family protein [Paenibacillus sp. GD4]
MNTALQTIRQISQWSWLKRSLLAFTILTFLTSSFLFLTGPGNFIRQKLAETVISTQHRSWAWIFVGAAERDEMVKRMQEFYETAAAEKQNFGMINIKDDNRKKRSIDELIKVEDISGQFWKGKKLTVYDPKTIRVMTPVKSGEGEKISAMVKRTGAVAGVNGGGFDDPEGLGNGFAAIGAILSGGEIVFIDQDGSIPQHIVGFTKEGLLVVGKYDMFELEKMGVTDAVSFWPRLIANGKPQITSGDGGWGRGPRTAVGQKADGTVIFLVIDGRQAHSVGATLKEMQDIFMEEGVINAGNLDGGASSELVVDGQLITKPSSRYGERRLPSAFLVYDNPDAVKAPRPWDGVDKIDAGGSHDHPDFLREQAEKKAKQQQNPTPATTPKPETPKQETPKQTTPTETVKPATETTTKPATTPTPTPTTGTGEQPKPATEPAAATPSTTTPPVSGGSGTPATGTGTGAVTPAPATGGSTSGTTAPAPATGPTSGTAPSQTPTKPATDTGTKPAPTTSTPSTTVPTTTGQQPAQSSPAPTPTQQPTSAPAAGTKTTP